MLWLLIGKYLIYLQIIQDNYLEEALKMRNVLAEFIKKRHGQRRPSILGLREHIFTGRFISQKKKFSFSLLRMLFWATFLLFHFRISRSCNISVFLPLPGSCPIKKLVSSPLANGFWLIHWGKVSYIFKVYDQAIDLFLSWSFNYVFSKSHLS